MKRFRIIVLYIIASVLLLSCTSKLIPDKTEDRQVNIFPDYTGVIFPCNIAPPNFAIEETGDGYMVEIGEVGKDAAIAYESSKPAMYIPQKKWKNLLNEVKGKNIYFRTYVKTGNRWTQYSDIVNTISPEPIDEYLAYRIFYPGYSVLWGEMGIYQRNLTSYHEDAILENQSINNGCANCHSFKHNSPDVMLMHIRGAGGGTIILKDGKSSKVSLSINDINSRVAYVSWHPTGKYIAFSINQIPQFYHLTGKKPIEVADTKSDLAFYDSDTGEIFTDSKISGDEFMETFPNWSPDGKTLYFCRTNPYVEGMFLDSIHYDLYKISFDPITKKIGEPVCIYNASENKKSVSFPRISPDGRYMMFTLLDYGNFSIWHPESDLYILDLKTDEVRCLEEVNSDNVDSFHNWSSTGQWFVFSSKRMDGLFARPYIAAFDPATGKPGKAFVMPQKDPYFYTKFAKTYNVPDFIIEPVKNKRAFLQ